MDVYKFGGTSVGSADNMMKVIGIIRNRIEVARPLVVVSSAMSGITDLLIAMSKEAAQGKESYLGHFHRFRDLHTQTAMALLGDSSHPIFKALDENHQVLKDLLKGIYLVREVSPRTLDYVLSFGERNACYLLAKALHHNRISARYIDARQLVVTNRQFNHAKVDFDATQQKVTTFFKDTDSKEVSIVTGFIAADKGGLTTTLGRGGSDYTAAILAACLDADTLEIWTDVDGVLTTDPRKVSEAFTIPELSYSEAMEMSHFGAKVIYPPTILPALQKGIPIFIRNTFNPEFKGSKISASRGDSHHEVPIKGISSLNTIALMSLIGSGMMGVPGISARLFRALYEKEINVILITQASSEYTITFAIQESEVELATEALQDAFEKEIAHGQLSIQTTDKPMSIIAVVGEGMKSTPGISGRLFEVLGQNGININAIAQGSSELNISFVINRLDEKKALNLIHDAFFLSAARKYHLYIVGVGLIGSTLLEQISSQHDYLMREHNLDIRVAGIANSKHMAFDNLGLHTSDYQEALNRSNLQSDVSSFITRMIEDNLPNTIFVDNTASASYSPHYADILAQSISIVTPNKIAASSSYEQYKRLKQIAKSRNIAYLYETNVGAALPILSTMKSLIDSGDRIHKIEAVLSGSLSFIFNNYDGSQGFADVISEAKRLGYTEPDPRDDLSGKDLQRKSVILAREAGFPIEMSDVVIHPILSSASLNAATIDAFMQQLASEDDRYRSMVEKAFTNNRKLRIVCNITVDQSTVQLTEVDENHPFYSLQGSDNMIVIYSDRYSTQPLIIRGPGAGAAVTAGGVFSDILYIAKNI